MEEKITTFMGNTTTPTISAAQKDKCEGVVVESELLYICIKTNEKRLSAGV